MSQYGVKFILFILILNTILSCASPNLIEISNTYTQLAGKLSATPSLESGNSRLFIYLTIVPEIEKNEEQIVVCLATNREVRTILIELKEKLLAAKNETIFLYVTKSSGKHEEIISGVDYDVHAVGVYVPESKKYRIILTAYGEGLRSALSDVTWSQFVQKILEKGIKAAF